MEWRVFCQKVRTLQKVKRAWKKLVEDTYKTNPLKNPLVQQWVLAEGIFASTTQLSVNSKRYRAIKELESAWGNRMTKKYYASKKNTSQWTTVFGENLVKSMLLELGEAPRRGRFKQLRPDWETDKAWYEVKTRTYTTPGTAGDKILAVPNKYVRIPKITHKPLYVVLVAYQEYEAYMHPTKSQDFGFDDLDYQLYLTSIDVRFVKASTLLKQCKSYQYRKMSEDTFYIEIETPPSTPPRLPTLRPFLKWVGGKTEILDKVFAQFDRVTADRPPPEKYIEPFIGGGSVFSEYMNRGHDVQYLLSDANQALITTYQTIQQDHESLLRELEVLADDYEKAGGLEKKSELYYKARNEFNEKKREGVDSVRIAALFVFLNKTCFRGLYRENSRGDFNVPFGNYASFPQKLGQILLDWHRVLASYRVEFTCQGFEAIAEHLDETALVYLDPPYAAEDDKNSFTTYAKGGFGPEQQAKIKALCESIVECGAKFVLSNSDCTLIRELYPTDLYEHEVIEVKRRITSNKPQSTTGERLIYAR